jgi:hypothetical protein
MGADHQRVSPSLSDQYAFTAIWKPIDNLSIDLSTYLKDMRSHHLLPGRGKFPARRRNFSGQYRGCRELGNKITVGNGDAAGVELQFIYDYKKLQFNLNGSWSRSYRTFEDINDGEPFPDRYDRRWSTSFSGQLKLNAKLSCGMNFLFGSGIAITLAQSKFFNPEHSFPKSFSITPIETGSGCRIITDLI